MTRPACCNCDMDASDGRPPIHPLGFGKAVCGDCWTLIDEKARAIRKWIALTVAAGLVAALFVAKVLS